MVTAEVYRSGNETPRGRKWRALHEREDLWLTGGAVLLAQQSQLRNANAFICYPFSGWKGAAVAMSNLKMGSTLFPWVVANNGQFRVNYHEHRVARTGDYWSNLSPNPAGRPTTYSRIHARPILPAIRVTSAQCTHRQWMALWGRLEPSDPTR
jgi:hypothetical protein